jgi:threonine aldolase
LDGARIFNALVAQNISANEMGKNFDSISICLSKGLGCPIGSVLIGTKEFIHQAKRIRKIFGGGMRQAGIVAAAGIYALNNHVERLKEDHENAFRIAKSLEGKDWIESIQPVESNIVIFELKDSINQDAFIAKMSDVGILVVGMGPQLIRIVTHLDIHEKHIDFLIEKLDGLYLHF